MFDETKFQNWFQNLPWYQNFRMKYGESPNSDDPDYDYREAYSSGQGPNPLNDHWPSQFKGIMHPRRFLELDENGQENPNGQLTDTLTMMPTNDYEIMLKTGLGKSGFY